MIAEAMTELGAELVTARELRRLRADSVSW
jgi:hypothetical protein